MQASSPQSTSGDIHIGGTQSNPMACLMYSNAGSFLCMSRATLQWFMPTVEQGSQHSACLHTIL